MQVDVIFDFAKVYDINRFDVASGQSFKLTTDHVGKSKWFADNDEVLEMKVTDNNGAFVAKDKGTSTLLIMDENKTILKEITISVVDAVVPQAVSLNLSADAPEPKEVG
jgi:membrane carboxypeptidase/penicillin-binding protein PbpC